MNTNIGYIYIVKIPKPKAIDCNLFSWAPYVKGREEQPLPETTQIWVFKSSKSDFNSTKHVYDASLKFVVILVLLTSIDYGMWVEWCQWLPLEGMVSRSRLRYNIT